VVEVVAPGLRGDTITVGDIMAPNLMTVRESDGVLDALQAMRYRGVRRLPVVGDDGGLRGLVAIDDILEILTEGLSDISRIIRQEHGVEAANRK
jgi:CBS domain-containing protein